MRGDTPLTRAGVPTKPFAFTNPIYVDADGDGAWTRGAPAAAADAGTRDGGSAEPPLPIPPPGPPLPPPAP